MVQIERMTAGALARGGISGGRLTLLAEQALRGNSRARRALERAAGHEMTVVLHRDDAPCPLEFPDAERRRRGILVAPVGLGRGTWWEDDTLYGSSPDTIASAAIGRPLSDVLGHADIDPDTITLPPRRIGGLVSVQRMTMTTVRPTMTERLTHPAYRLRLLAQDGRMPRSASAGLRTLMAVVTAICMAALVVRTVDHPQGEASTIVTVMLVMATIHSIWCLFNMSRPRPFSMLQAAMAGTRHTGDLEKIRKLRGEAHGSR
jgi:hypothetical protein